jgi:hypothetical protein
VSDDETNPIADPEISGEGMPDLPPAPGTRRRVPNRGRYDRDRRNLPMEFFAIGMSGRARRNPRRVTDERGIEHRDVEVDRSE